METTNASYLNRLAHAALRLNGRLFTSPNGMPQKGTKGKRLSITPHPGTSLGHTGSPIFVSNHAVPTNSGMTTVAQMEKELAEQKRTEADLRQRIAALETKVKEQAEQIQEMDTYAYTVAHGLKTPLSVITFASEMLIQSETSGQPDPDAPELLEGIHNMGNKMARIIEDLLTLTGISQSKVAVEPVDMEQILWEVQERLATKVARSNAKISFATPPESWPVAKGNRALIEEVWDNFISNAIKYGGEPPMIELGAKKIPGNMIQFWVQDNGHGIPMTTQNRLFKAFNRLHVNLADGHGLGLAIVDRIIRKLGGTVAVESSGIPGEGSKFSFTLPAA